MRSWYVKPKGLAPPRCSLGKGDILFCAVIGGSLGLVILVLLVAF